jgi:hypothetical protein
MQVGEFVIYVDPVGKERPALITAVWGGPNDLNPPALNVVFVNDDENQKDNYGRKIERMSSVVHRTNQHAHGQYWKAIA